MHIVGSNISFPSRFWSRWWRRRLILLSISVGRRRLVVVVGRGE
jgi:hypothetical protein